MARIVSFVVLVVILILIAALFIHVMANFILPLFLAVLLAILFRPLYDQAVAACRGHDRVAAALTTTAVLLIVLAPIFLIIFLAVVEAKDLYQSKPGEAIGLAQVSEATAAMAANLGLKVSAGDIENAVRERGQAWLAPAAVGTTQFVGGFLLGLVIMVVSLYYFLVDGAAMVRTMMRLSPLEEHYEQQLVDQFENITRAMVMATLLSALAQGLLAGIGFYLAGFQYVFLMTLLTMFLAMVPFVGAAAVWVPASLWLFFYEDRLLAALLLAGYGVAVVSSIDNVIKPWVLHGRSNLHPLLALLSVLGGVQALGPIGIFVGPMAVAFLYALLNMFQKEVTALEREAYAPADRCTCQGAAKPAK